MPVLSDSAPVKRPNDNLVIAKYLDISKFLSLLTTKSLFFARLDLLEDKFEGTIPNSNIDLRFKIIEHFANTNNLNRKKEDIEKEVNNLVEFQNLLRVKTLVNCWHKFTNESSALWKIYSAQEQGIMIKSTVGSLVKSLQKSTAPIY